MFDGSDGTHADRGNISGQPGHVLGPDGVVMRKCCPVIDERLLDGTLDLKILLHLASQLLPEAEREVQTGPTRISMADVTSGPGTNSAFADFGAQNGATVPIQLGDIAPYGRGLAHVGCDIAIKQEVADVGEIILGCLK